MQASYDTSQLSVEAMRRTMPPIVLTAAHVEMCDRLREFVTDPAAKKLLVFMPPGWGRTTALLHFLANGYTGSIALYCAVSPLWPDRWRQILTEALPEGAHVTQRNKYSVQFSRQDQSQCHLQLASFDWVLDTNKDPLRSLGYPTADLVVVDALANRKELLDSAFYRVPDIKAVFVLSCPASEVPADPANTAEWRFVVERSD